MKLVKGLLFGFVLFVISFLNFLPISYTLANKSIVDTYTSSLSKTMGKHGGDLTDDAIREWTNGDAFNKQVIILIWYVIEIFIAIWVAVALFWSYKIMVSDKEDSSKDWIKMVLFWILWIIIMVSAKFLANSLVWDEGIISNNIQVWDVIISYENPAIVWFNWIKFASQLYGKIVYPFIKIALYLVVGVLFFITVAKVITYVTSTDDSAKKKAWWIIIWTVIWILIIMWAKQIVESIMWKQSTVADWENLSNATQLSDIWNHITDFESIPLVAQVINWVMWLTMLIILILIIIQAYRIFSKPDDPKNRETMKKTILYIIIWVLVIWAAYAISTVLVVNRIGS